MIISLKHRLLIVFLSIWVGISYSQEDFSGFIETLKVYDLENLTDSIIEKSELKEFEKFYLKSQRKLVRFLDTVSIVNNNLTTNNLDKKKNILHHIILGDYYYLSNPLSNPDAYKHYDLAFELSNQIGDSVLIAESCKKIITFLYENKTAYNLSTNYLKKYKDYLFDDNEIATYSFYYNTIEAAYREQERTKELKNGLRYAKSAKNDYLVGKYYQTIGIFHSHFFKNKDSAIWYMKKAEEYFKRKNYNYFQKELAGVYGNLGQYYLSKKDTSLAKNYFVKADGIDIPKYKYQVKEILNQLLSDLYYQASKVDSAYHHQKLSKLYNDTLSNALITATINKTKIETNVEKKEKKIISQEKDLLNRLNLIILIGFSSLFVIIIVIIKNKNIKRKVAITEKEKELETQKNLTLLKEQEIATINAMVEGQEKERKRVAEDLHDNLGSVIATLKLHFENLRLNRKKQKIDQETLFDKTENLIDEAYQKVRSIAHAKNSGVIANQGLLVAVKLMAEKVSFANSIQIDVIDYGLEKPLENSLEISLFRIIQELTTNIIKHAKANHATINISQDQEDITVLIEDDGIGMNTSKINPKKGMGLHSIETRIKHLDGSFTIDSTPNKGTTIIINIPI